MFAGVFLMLTLLALALARAAYLEATRWVSHSQDVKLAIARARVAVDEGDVGGAGASLGEIRALTADNPRQRARLESFRADAPDVRTQFDALTAEEDVLLSIREADERSKRVVVWFVLGGCSILAIGLTVAAILIALRDERALARHTALLGSILDSIGDSVVAIDRQRRFVVTNAAFRHIFAEGLTHGQLALETQDRQHPEDADGTPLGADAGPLPRALRGEHVDNLIMSLQLADDGQRIWLSATSRPVLDDGGDVSAAVAVLRDVTREREDRALLARHAEELRRQSLVDELTGLYNRRGFLLLAEQYARASARSKRPFAVLFADLNGLKAINDEHGHDEGDRAIRRMAAVLKATLRESDIVARLGGDEYVALLDGAEEAVAAGLLERLQHEIAVEGAREAKPYSLSVSTGVAFQRAGEAQTIERLLALADERMYAQKAKSRPSRA
jgi:diguanylate cyclase (GGDEF)-like protein/PAS domain S-box-containing protein